MAHIVIIEDEPDLAMGLRDNLEFEKHTVARTYRPGGIALVSRKPPDLILLDICCRTSTASKSPAAAGGGFRMPILIYRPQPGDRQGAAWSWARMITSQAVQPEGAAGAHSGGVAPCATPAKPVLQFRVGQRMVDLVAQKITTEKEELPLGYYESEILRMLYERVGMAVPRADLLEQIWGAGVYPADRTVDNHIVSLRRKLEPDPKNPRHILTAHAVGYKLVL